ncbi:ACP S-malonyltransferase [Thalassotalea ganghwensis]
MSKKQTAVVICPGRGTYNKEELGYLARYHQDKLAMINLIDDYREQQGQPAIKALDGQANYQMRQHTAGENASALIYGCALGDFHSIDRDKYDIVGVTGNSMGWYIALALAGVLKPLEAITLINTMGSMMSAGVIGGQLIYPVVDEDWHEDKLAFERVMQTLSEVNQGAGNEVYLSINLGGYLVFGGNNSGLKALEQALPVVQDRYPMNLFNHGAFHTPLMNDIAVKAQNELPISLFDTPEIPLIDGLGKIWQPYSTDLAQLYSYTLGYQVTQPYDFAKAVEVALKEFAPDKLIILGPGSTLGGSVAQNLIKHRWLGIDSKASFIQQQKQAPFVLAMGLAEQRKLVV